MEEKKFIVYKHTSPSNKVYIGITSQKPKIRWNNGKRYQSNEYFTNAISKYGWENFKHEILFDNMTKEQAEQKEIELIALYNSTNRDYGYNIRAGGSCTALNEISKEKLRQANLGKHHSEETKRKMSINNARYNKGKHLSEETIKILSESHKGKHLSEEQKKKISEKLKNRYFSCEHKKKISESKKGINNAMYGVTNENHPRSKKVMCVETGIIYANGIEAQRQTGIKYKSINAVCNGKRNKTGGLHWKFID